MEDSDVLKDGFGDDSKLAKVVDGFVWNFANLGGILYFGFREGHYQIKNGISYACDCLKNGNE